MTKNVRIAAVIGALGLAVGLTACSSSSPSPAATTAPAGSAPAASVAPSGGLSSPTAATTGGDENSEPTTEASAEGDNG